MIIKNAKVYQENNTFRTDDIYIDGSTIVEHIPSNQTIYDADGLFAIPGLTDIHFHGCAGRDFCEGKHEAILDMAKYQAKHGITTICPATMTLSEEMLSFICEAAGSYDNREGAILCGINMEGPFISPAKKGAQCAEFIRKPDASLYRRLQLKSGNLIKLLAVAPEVEGALDFISEIKNEVTVSIAHTRSDYDLSRKALSCGASHVTHLYNAMQPFNHREPGVIGAAFDTPNCEVELICDGIHIHPSVVRATFQLYGANRIIMISDSMMATGMPDGEYSLGGQKVRVSAGRATLGSSEVLAGSTTNLMECMRNAVMNMGIPLELAVQCAAANPAKSIGIYDKYGSITPGKIANIVLLDKDLNIKAIILKGTILPY